MSFRHGYSAAVILLGCLLLVANYHQKKNLPGYSCLRQILSNFTVNRHSPVCKHNRICCLCFQIEQRPHSISCMRPGHRFLSEFIWWVWICLLHTDLQNDCTRSNNYLPSKRDSFLAENKCWYLCCDHFHLLAGIKFIVLTDPKLGYVDGLLKRLYELYSDYALKNPYYSIDMPIRYHHPKLITIESFHLLHLTVFFYIYIAYLCCWLCDVRLG